MCRVLYLNKAQFFSAIHRDMLFLENLDYCIIQCSKKEGRINESLLSCKYSKVTSFAKLKVQTCEWINSDRVKCICIVQEFRGGGAKERLGAGAKALGFINAGLSGGRAGSA